MMYANPKCLEAAALARGQSGLGFSKEEGIATGINTANAYLRSDGDALVLFDGVFKFIGTAALKLPPPFNVIAGVVSYLGGKGLTTVRKFLERSARSCAKYLPVDVAEKVVGKFKSSWFTYASEAAKDKLVQASRTNAALRLALQGANAYSDQDLNLNVSNRLANRIYVSAIAAGASKKDAAMAAWAIAKDSGASQSVLKNYAAMTGAKTNFELANPQLAWEKGKNKISSAQAKAAGVGTQKGGAAAPLLLAAAGLALTFLG